MKQKNQISTEDRRSSSLKNPVHLFVFLIVLLLPVASCSPFKPSVRPSPEGELPQTFSLYTSESEPPPRWWEGFNDPELNMLVIEALSDNFSLKKAWTRLRQANSAAIQAGATLYPDLSGAASALSARQRSGSGPFNTRTTEEYSVGVSSNYELDLWGRIRSQREAALLEATATREDLNAAAMTLVAEVTNHWINIISQRMQKQLLKKQVQINRTYLELIELRFRASMASAVDVYQQKQVVEDVMAEMPLVEAQERLLLHQLALLLGKPPQTAVQISRIDLPEPMQVPATGFPADLLAARPDLRAAGLRLKAADWQVAAARANRLPAINLTAQAVYGKGALDVLFDTWLLSLAGNLTAPIFDGKRRAAEVDRTLAIADENLLAYREAVFTAIKEVEDALVSESKQQEHIDSLKQVMDTAQRAFEEAGVRYRNGLTDYLPVLTQLLTVQRLERDLIQKRANLLIARIGLYRALGGMWPDSLKP